MGITGHSCCSLLHQTRWSLNEFLHISSVFNFLRAVPDRYVLTRIVEEDSLVTRPHYTPGMSYITQSSLITHSSSVLLAALCAALLFWTQFTHNTHVIHLSSAILRNISVFGFVCCDVCCNVTIFLTTAYSQYGMLVTKLSDRSAIALGSGC